jgi:hypothetical protein
MMKAMGTEGPSGCEGEARRDAEAWDANDPRRQRDPFAPPAEPCECHCLHCRRNFMSSEIWFQKINGSRDGLEGFWMCPTPNCDGAGFTFDIFPIDPNHPANEGWSEFDGDEEIADDDVDPDLITEAAFTDDDAFSNSLDNEPGEPQAEYDPAEPQYQILDQWNSDEDDIEGEEWKYGLQPGEHPHTPASQWMADEEDRYDEPDERPRELDWNDVDRPSRGAINDEDIPF